MLTTLLLNAGRLTSAESLIQRIWESPPETAKAQVHNLISSLRRRFRAEDPDLVETRAAGYVLHLDRHWLDLAEFRELSERGRAAVAAADHAAALALLDRALALWRGPALADVPEYADLREGLHRERLTTAEAKLESALALGDHDAVLRAVEPLLADHPYAERLHRQRMLALAGAGRRDEALAAYRRAYREFVANLGVAPGPLLREAEQQILRGEPPADGATTTGLIPRQLPPAVQLTGRDELLRQVTDSAGSDPATVLLVGPAGVGKTALAVATGHRLRAAYPDGQLFADLRGSHDPPADPYHIAERFLRALGASGSEIPDDPEERISSYRSHLARGRFLVVLDDAADEAQVRPLLPGAPGTGAVVTSRRQLAALLEAARFPVPALPAADGIRLLAKGAGESRMAAEPQAATEIIRLCGGLPLAVCVTAARLAVRPEITLDELRQRLAVERGRLDQLAVGDLDVRASISLSYQALPDDARRLFRRLGLLATPDWPSWVVGTLQTGTRDLLERLVDVHLVQPLGRDGAGQDRYRLHDLVAEYAAERAEAEDSAAERRDAVVRTLEGWLALATEADERVGHGMRVAAGLATPAAPPDAGQAARDAPREWFEAERECLLAAVHHAGRLGRSELAGTLALRTAGYLILRAYGDLEPILRTAIDEVRRHGQDRLLLRLLSALSVAHAQRSRNTALSATAAEVFDLARRLGDREQEMRALLFGSVALRRQGRLAEAVDRGQRAVAMCGPDTPPLVANRAHVGLAISRWESGRSDLAVTLVEEALEIVRRNPDARATAITLIVYGNCLLELGRLTPSKAAFEEGLRVCREIGDEEDATYLECHLADIAVRQGRWQDAADLVSRAEEAHVRLGCVEGEALALRCRGDLALAQGVPGDALEPLRRSLAIFRRLDQPLDVARTLVRLDAAQDALGDGPGATRQQWRAILDRLRLDDACLLLPPHLTSHSVTPG